MRGERLGAEPDDGAELSGVSELGAWWPGEGCALCAERAVE
jgi:hypothetical protein